MNLDWMTRAACAGRSDLTNVFFPERGEDVKPAKAICAACPVADECLSYALSMRATSGIFGGKSERERRKIRGRRPCIECGVKFTGSQREGNGLRMCLSCRQKVLAS